jgi:hypothetical protein
MDWKTILPYSTAALRSALPQPPAASVSPAGASLSCPDRYSVMPELSPSNRFPKPDRPLGSVSADIWGLIVFSAIVVALILAILAVILTSRPM